MTELGANRQGQNEVSAALALAEKAEMPPAADFAAAYDAEFEGVWLYLRRLGVPAADVEDAVHDVFVVAHRRYATYDRTRPLRPWLLGIAFRVAAQWRRQRRREVDVDEPGRDLPDTKEGPDSAYESQEVRIGAVEELLDETVRAAL